MSVFWRRRTPAAITEPAAEHDRRSAGIPYSLSDYFGLYAGGRGYADVNASTPAVAMQSVAVGSAIDLLASLGSELPVKYYRRRAGEAREEVDPPVHMLDPGGDGHGEQDWRYQVLVSWLTRGNLFGDIVQRAAAGYPTQVIPFDPMAVSGYMDGGAVRWFVKGTPVDDLSRFLHRRVAPNPGQILGRSPLEQHADTVGVSLSALRFGKQWFTDGAHPSGMLTNSEVDLAGTDLIASVKAQFMAALYGTREPLVLGRGWQYKPIQVTAEESQFLASMGWSEAQSARIYGPGVAEALGYETGGSLTYSTAESQARVLLVYSADKWLSRIDRLMTSMVRPGLFAEIERNAMLAATTIERFRAHHLALSDGWRTINEIRAVENQPPVPWGDEPFVPAKSADPGKDDGDDSDPTQDKQPGGAQ